jgi:ADP-L-glycero-D-manno-heptose 6-epimerase
MILVTGGAGFIGSYLQAELFARGQETVIADWLGAQGKWRNLARHPPGRIVAPDELEDFLDSNPPIEAVMHMGAISETMAADGDLVWRTNVELSQRLWAFLGRHLWRRPCRFR